MYNDCMHCIEFVDPMALLNPKSKKVHVTVNLANGKLDHQHLGMYVLIWNVILNINSTSPPHEQCPTCLHTKTITKEASTKVCTL